MKLHGFVNGAYTLDSVEVDAQRCVNLYPAAIESGTGKGAQKGYLRNTPGLQSVGTCGNGPIRMIHEDSEGRVIIASGNGLFRYASDSEASMDMWTRSFVNASPFDFFGFGIISSLPDDTFRTSSGHVPSNWVGPVWVTFTQGTTPPTPLVNGTDYIAVYDNGATNRFNLYASLADYVNDVKITCSGTPAGSNNFLFRTPDVKLEAFYSNIDYTANSIGFDATHGLSDIDKVYFGSYGVPLPNIDFFYNGIDATPSWTEYFVKVVDTTTIKLATSAANVYNEVFVDLTAPTTNFGKIATNSFTDPDATGKHVQFDSTAGIVNGASSNPGTASFTSQAVFVDGTESWVLHSGVETFYDLTVGFVSQPYNYDWGYIYFNYFGVTPGTTSTIPATHVAWIDGYYILTKTDTSDFFVSDLNAVQVDPTSFAQAEGSPDKVMGLIANRRDLWVFGEKTIEVYVNTGNADFPFERIQSGFTDIGCVAANSISQMEGNVFWLGRSKDGDGIVYIASSLSPQRISTHAIEQAIAGYADISTATAYTYQEKGHKFYVLNFAEASWVFDMSTGLWHERMYLNAGNEERHRGDVQSFASNSGKHLVGDYSTNEVYEFLDSVYTDDGDTIRRERVTPHMSNENFRIFCDELFLDMKTGVGLASGQGSDPQVMLQWSDDGGNTWSDEAWTSAGGQSGGIGDYSKRVRWRRLGSFRDRIFRFRITDPVEVKFIDAYLKVRQGRS